MFEAEWAEADLRTPGQTRTQALRKRATLRAARFKLCWAATLQGPLRDAARQAVQAAAAAASATGGPGAADAQQRLSTELLPLLLGSGDDADAGSLEGGAAGREANGGGGGGRERLTLGSLARRACTALGLRPDEAPPEATTGDDLTGGGDDDLERNGGNVSDGGGGGADSDGAVTALHHDHSNGHLLVSSARTRETEPAGRAAAVLFPDAHASSTPTPVEGPAFSTPAVSEDKNNIARDAQCVEWLFGPRQAAWLTAETAVAGAAAAAAWRALDAVLAPATVLVASRASRGTEFSSVWARPDCLVWAKQAKNCYWPAMLLWGSKTNPALKEVNKDRVPPAFREELEKQVNFFFFCVFFETIRLCSFFFLCAVWFFSVISLLFVRTIIIVFLLFFFACRVDAYPCFCFWFSHFVFC